MSGTKRKKLSPEPIEVAEEPATTRLVVLPKEPEKAAPAAAKAAKPKPERIGEILRQARRDRGDDLYQIADYLCIKPAFLVALENSRYDELPADAYVIGFLRTYANFLGVDGKDAVDRYRYEMAGRRKKPVLAMPIPLSEGRAPSALIMVGASIAALLIYALWYGISSSNRTEVNVPPPLPTVQQTAPAVETPIAAPTVVPTSVTPASSASPPSPTATIPPASPGIIVNAGSQAAPTPTTAAPDTKDGKSQIYGDPGEAARLIIRATQSTWILVTDASGKVAFDHVLKPGDIYKVPNKQGLSLTTGNGAGIVLVLDGAELPKVASGAPHVVKGIPLDPARLTTTPSAQ